MPKTENPKPRTSRAKTPSPTTEPKPQCHIHDDVKGLREESEIRKNVCVIDEELIKYQGKHYCLFHLPHTNKDIKKFELIFWTRIEKNNQEFTNIDKLPDEEQKEAKSKFTNDFRYVWFPSEVDLADYEFKANVDFSSATFSEYVYFNSVTFSGEADFCSVTFSDYADFTSTTFSGRAVFKSATFWEYAYFNSATFSGEADFCSVTFNAQADFRLVVFSEFASFSYAIFSESSYFNSAIFLKTSFLFANFRDDTDFNSATFSANACFNSARFSGYTDFSSATFTSDANFSLTVFTVFANFSSATFMSDANFSSATFTSDANFSSATFTSEAYFGSATFTSAADFSSATFKSKAYFISATFMAEAYFRSATFTAAADFSSAKLLETSQIFFYQTSFQSVADFRLANVKGYLYFEAGDGKFFEGEWVDEEKVNPKKVNRWTSVFEGNSNFANIHTEKPERILFYRVRLNPSWFINVNSRKMVFNDVSWENVISKRKNANLTTELDNQGESISNHLLQVAVRQLAINAEENCRYEEAANFWQMASDLNYQQILTKTKSRRNNLRNTLNIWFIKLKHFIGLGKKDYDQLNKKNLPYLRFSQSRKSSQITHILQRILIFLFVVSICSFLYILVFYLGYVVKKTEVDISQVYFLSLVSMPDAITIAFISVIVTGLGTLFTQFVALRKEWRDTKETRFSRSKF